MWIARDKNNTLVIYGEKPWSKDEDQWRYAREDYQEIDCDVDICPEVKWEDEEPTELEPKKILWKDPDKELPKDGERVIYIDSKGKQEFGYYVKSSKKFNTYTGEEDLWEGNVEAWCSIPKYDLNKIILGWSL